MNTPEATPTYDLIVSLDRSDASVAVVLLHPVDGVLAEHTVSTAPEELDRWWMQLKRDHPLARLIVAFEQPAPNLLAFSLPAVRPPFCPQPFGYLGVPAVPCRLPRAHR